MQLANQNIAVFFAETNKYLHTNCFQWCSTYQPLHTTTTSIYRFSPEGRQFTISAWIVASKAQSSHNASTEQTLYFIRTTHIIASCRPNSLYLILNLKRCSLVHCCPFYRRLQLINVPTLISSWLYTLFFPLSLFNVHTNHLARIIVLWLQPDQHTVFWARVYFNPHFSSESVVVDYNISFSSATQFYVNYLQIRI